MAPSSPPAIRVVSSGGITPAYQQLAPKYEKATGTRLISALTASPAAPALTFALRSDELAGQLTTKQFLNGMGYVGENLSPRLS